MQETQNVREPLPVFRVRDWTVDPPSGEIQRNGDRHRLEPKVMEVLGHLVRHRGEVVSKDQLFAAVWPDTYVTEDSLWRCIAGLRKIFGDDAKEPRYIETLPRRGYRLVAPVCFQEPKAQGAETTQGGTTQGETTQETGTGLRSGAPGRWKRAALALASGALLVLAGIWFSRQTETNRPDLADTSGEATGATAALESLPPDVSLDELYARAEDLRSRRESLPQARELYERILAEDPEHAAAQIGLASTLVRMGWHRQPVDQWHREALEAARRALELAPDSARAHKTMGSVHHAEGLLREAAAHYETALEIEPTFWEAANNLAVVYRVLGELDLSLRWQIRRLSGTDEHRSLQRANVAETHLLLGDLAAAREYAISALEIEPRNPLARNVLLRAALTEGALGDARQQARELVDIVEVAPPGFQVASLLWVATAAELDGDLAAAERHIESALEASGGMAGSRTDALLYRAHLAQRRGDTGHAAELLAEAEEHLDDLAGNPRVDGWLGPVRRMQLLALRGQAEEALDSLEKAAAFGFVDYQWLEIEPTLAALRGAPPFEEWIERLRDRVARMRGQPKQTAPSVLP